MAKKKEENKYESSLLDNWLPPQGAGEPIGLIATSYTFDSNFFESQCLARFVGMSTDSDSQSFAYLIEREEKLSKLKFCSVLVDKDHANGIRNLRWDLISVKVPNGTMHSKVVCLVWENYFRVIIGSGNLTESGQCKNREVFVNLEGGFDKIDNLEFTLKGLSEHLSKIAAHSGLADKKLEVSKKFNTGLTFIKEEIEKPTLDEKKNISLVFIEPDKKESLFDQVAPSLPNSKIDSAIVTSPFFDDEDDEQKMSLQNNFGSFLSKNARVNIVGPAEVDQNTNALRFYAPESVLKGYSKDKEIQFTPYFPLSEQNGDSVRRELHMKSYCFTRKKKAVFVVGSSNFTKPGTGVKTNNHSRRNFEANVVFEFVKNSRRMNACIQSVNPALNPNFDEKLQIVWSQSHNIEEKIEDKSSYIPSFFSIATLEREGEDRILYIKTSGTINESWEIFADINMSYKLYESKEWEALGRQQNIKIKLSPNKKALCEVFIKLDSGHHFAIPVLVGSEDVVLTIPEIEDLDIDDLMAIYLSGKPAYRIIDQILKNKKKKKEKGEEKNSPVDSHNRVDQSSFLLTRARRISTLIGSIRRKFERPIYSHSSLKFLIDGPFGIYKIAESIASIEGITMDEVAFFIGEMCFELKFLNIETVKLSLPESEVRNELKKTIDALWEKYCQGLDPDTSIHSYVNDLSKKVAA